MPQELRIETMNTKIGRKYLNVTTESLFSDKNISVDDLERQLSNDKDI